MLNAVYIGFPVAVNRFADYQIVIGHFCVSTVHVGQGAKTFSPLDHNFFSTDIMAIHSISHFPHNERLMN